MSQWCFRPSPEQLAAVTAAQEAFRAKCASIRLPFGAEFDGTIEDVHAVDYMEYEGLDFPACGLEAAAFVCGEVLRRAAGLEWVISYRDGWFVASENEARSPVVICPLARLHELECSGVPQFGKHLWFLQEAAFECLLRCGPERETTIRELLDDEGEYLDYVKRTLEALWPGRSGGSSSRAEKRAERRKRKG